MLILLLALSLFSVSSASVQGDAVEVKPGETIVIPVNISDNTGVMGFKATVEYPSDVFCNPEVSRGVVTAKGMFNDSIVEATNGEFDVLWNHTADVKEDGVIFLMQFDVTEFAEDGNYAIKLTYSQPDTFNEKWEDVVLNVSDISVDINSDAEATDTTIQRETVPKNNEDYVKEILGKVDSKYIQESIEDALEGVGVPSISELDDDKYENFDNIVSHAIDTYGVEVQNKPSDKQGYEALYNKAVADNFIASVLEYVDSEDVITVIDNVLKSYSVDGVEEISDESVDDFVSDVINELKEKGVQIEEIPYGVDKLKVIKFLYDEANEFSDAKNQIEPQMNNDNMLKIMNWLGGVVLVSIMITFVIVIIRRRRNKEEK